jgi:hypothetical protein
MTLQTAWTKLDIINLAFNMLGKKSVNDVVDSGEFADSANRAFDVLYLKELAQYDWRFASKIQQLSLNVTPPLDPFYQYSFNLPSDYLALRRPMPRVRWQLYEKQLWCNASSIAIEYRYPIDPTQCPAYFVNYFAMVLVKWYAKSVAEDSNLAANIAREMYLEKGTAMSIDAQSRPGERLFDNPVINARQNYWVGRYGGQ